MKNAVHPSLGFGISAFQLMLPLNGNARYTGNIILMISQSNKDIINLFWVQDSSFLTKPVLCCRPFIYTDHIFSMLSVYYVGYNKMDDCLWKYTYIF